MSVITVSSGNPLSELKINEPVICSADIDIDLNYELSNDIFKYIGNVSFAMPQQFGTSSPIHLSIDIFSDGRMENDSYIGSACTNEDDANKYFSVFFTNNDQSYWQYITNDIIDKGFPPAYANTQVVFSLKSFFINFQPNNIHYPLFIKYIWFNAADDTVKTDVNSILWPNFAEQCCSTNIYDSKIVELSAELQQLKMQMKLYLASND